MSRSGYSDEGDMASYNLWRASVSRSIKGKRGQAFLREMAGALDAMPVRELIREELIDQRGAVCAIGAVAVCRKLDVSALDVEDGDAVARLFGIARVLALEIAYENDERGEEETPAERWGRMRSWVDAQLGAP